MATLYASAYIGSATRNAGGTAAWFFQGFRVDRPAEVTGLRLYHPVQGTGTGGLPDSIKLFDSDGATALASDDLSGVTWPSSGTGAWVEVTLGTPVTLTPGQHYTVGYRAPANYGYAFDSNHPAMSENAGQEWLVGEGPAFGAANYTGIVATASGETPADPDTTNYDSFRVGADVTAHATTIEPGDVDGVLRNWLSVADNTEGNDSAPIHVEALATGATGFDAIKAVADAVAAAVSGIPGTIASAVTTITGQLTALTGTTAQTGIATIGAISHDLAGVFNHALDVLGGRVVTGSSSPNWVWTAGTPVDFDGAIFLAVAADAYLLHLRAAPDGLPLNVFDGVHVYFRSGWWCECIDGVGSERHYIDFEDTWLRDGVRRLGGCLVLLGPGGLGTITPYTLEPA